MLLLVSWGCVCFQLVYSLRLRLVTSQGSPPAPPRLMGLEGLPRYEGAFAHCVCCITPRRRGRAHARATPFAPIRLLPSDAPRSSPLSAKTLRCSL